MALEALEQISMLLRGDSAAAAAAAASPGTWSPLSPDAPCPLDCLVVPVGGGGLASGCATVAKALYPNLLVVGAEPEAMNDACRSKVEGSIQGNASGATTVADGLRTTLGPNTWPVVRDKVGAIREESSAIVNYVPRTVPSAKIIL